jgi:nucleotide-binding universal stress UspA family protein
MERTILVPLDGSSAAQGVLPYAVEIAAKRGAEIMLVSVSDYRVGDIDHIYRTYLERVTEDLQRDLEGYGVQGADLIRSDVLMGSPEEEILHYADEIDAYMIAMAGRGQSGRGPWLLGHIASKVIRQTKKNVLLVKSQPKLEAVERRKIVRKIMVPLDGSDIGASAVSCARDLAGALGAEVILYRVIEPVRPSEGSGPAMDVPELVTQLEANRRQTADSYLKRVSAEVKASGIKETIAVGYGFPASQILDFAESNSVDLIALSSHGHGGIGRWVFGSVTEKMLAAGDIPLLIVKAGC